MPILINNLSQPSASGQAPAAGAVPSATTDSAPALSASGTPSDQTSQPVVSDEQLKAHVSDALKKTGIKAEIDLSNSGYMVVRYIDPDNQKVQFQFPNQTVLDLVAALNQSTQANEPGNAGKLFDHFA